MTDTLTASILPRAALGRPAAKSLTPKPLIINAGDVLINRETKITLTTIAFGADQYAFTLHDPNLLRASAEQAEHTAALVSAVHGSKTYDERWKLADAHYGEIMKNLRGSLADSAILPQQPEFLIQGGKNGWVKVMDIITGDIQSVMPRGDFALRPVLVLPKDEVNQKYAILSRSEFNNRVRPRIPQP